MVSSNLRRTTKKTRRARLDADGKAEPLTHLVGVNVSPKGACLSPDDAIPTALVDESGARTSLVMTAVPVVDVKPEPKPKMYQIADFDAVRNRFTNYVLTLERLAQEVEGHMTLLQLVVDKDPNHGPSTVTYIMQQLQARLDAIHKLSQLK